jgi:hypothetical protein
LGETRKEELPEERTEELLEERTEELLEERTEEPWRSCSGLASEELREPAA